MKILDIITEAPLTDYQPLGDFERGRGGFRHEVDKRLVTNPVSVGKIHKFFQNSPYDIRIFPVQVRGGGRWLETGEVTPEKLVEIVGKDNAQRILAGQGPDNITIIFTNNTGAERIPLTAWMMAHRIGHAMRTWSLGGPPAAKSWDTVTRHFWRDLNRILGDYYRIPNTTPIQNANPEIYRAIIDAIGTMRSARQRTITRPAEFIYEMFAQYLNTGEVTFNPAPATLLSRRHAWGRPHHIRSIDKLNQQEANQALETLSHDMELLFNDVMSNALGRIYVM
jgi:hypothetical protein